MLHVKKAKYLGDYRIDLSFSDGREGIVDLKEWLKTTSLTPFRDLLKEKNFSNFHIDETIVWENGLDLAPEFLYFKAFEKDPELQERFKEWGYLEKNSDAA